MKGVFAVMGNERSKNMSMYENNEMDDLFYDMTYYIKKHGVADFIQIVADAVQYSEPSEE